MFTRPPSPWTIALAVVVAVVTVPLILWPAAAGALAMILVMAGLPALYRLRPRPGLERATLPTTGKLAGSPSAAASPVERRP